MNEIKIGFLRGIGFFLAMLFISLIGFLLATLFFIKVPDIENQINNNITLIIFLLVCSLILFSFAIYRRNH